MQKEIIEKIKKEAEKEKVDIEIYIDDTGYNNTDNLHTDTIRWVDISINELNDDLIADYKVLTAKEYNETILANTSETTDTRTMVVVLKDLIEVFDEYKSYVVSYIDVRDINNLLELSKLLMKIEEATN